ncbi:MAG: hypothetical protein INR71_05405 [Terriglobus roseus]|nr:hypothetical protein [Terriglobus roseus]
MVVVVLGGCFTAPVSPLGFVCGFCLLVLRSTGLVGAGIHQKQTLRPLSLVGIGTDAFRLSTTHRDSFPPLAVNVYFTTFITFLVSTQTRSVYTL